jgi:hypothetical protein
VFGVKLHTGATLTFRRDGRKSLACRGERRQYRATAAPAEDAIMTDTASWSAVGTRADHVTLRTSGAWIRIVERQGHWRRVDIRTAPDNPIDLAAAVRPDRNGRLTFDAGEAGLCQVEVSPGMPIRLVGTGVAWVIVHAPSASLSIDLKGFARAEIVNAAMVTALLHEQAQLTVERKIHHLDTRCADEAKLITADLVEAAPFESGHKIPARG